MFGSAQLINSRLISGVLVTVLLLMLLLAPPVVVVVVLIGVVAVVVVLVGVESIKTEDVLRLCLLVVVAGVILIGVADVGVGNNLDTDEGLRRCFFFLVVDDLTGVL